MIDLTRFKKELFLYSIVAAVVTEAVSVPFLGFDWKFAVGLVAGTSITAINFMLLSFAGQAMIKTGRGGPVVAGYFIRMLLYGVVFCLCIVWNRRCGFGCIFGFITLPEAIFFVYGIKSNFKGAKKNPLNDWDEPKEWNDLSQWDDEEDDWGVPPGTYSKKDDKESKK